MTQAPLPVSTDFTHTVLIVDSDQTLRDRLVPEVVRLLDAGAPVLVVVSDHTTDVLRAALGARAGQVEWGDQRAFYQRLGFAFEGFRRYLARQYAAGRQLHLIAEPDVVGAAGPGAPVDRVAAYLPYEAVCNDTYAAFGCPVTCLWDSRRHPADVLDRVRSVHGHQLQPSGPAPNPDFVRPADYLSARHDVLAEPPPDQVEMDVRLLGPTDLATMRRSVADWAAMRGFAAPAVGDVLLATTEVATNGLVHGAPPVRVRCWYPDDTLVVQVDDAGAMPLPPDAGYRPPTDATLTGGRGMWLARQLADSVVSHTAPGSTGVRLHFPRELTHRNPPGA